MARKKKAKSDGQVAYDAMIEGACRVICAEREGLEHLLEEHGIEEGLREAGVSWAAWSYFLQFMFTELQDDRACEAHTLVAGVLWDLPGGRLVYDALWAAAGSSLMLRQIEVAMAQVLGRDPLEVYPIPVPPLRLDQVVGAGG